MELDLEHLHQFIPLDRLGEKSLRYLLDRIRVLELQRGETLFRIGDQTPFVYYLVQGKILQIFSNGDRKVQEGGTDESRYALGNLLPRRMDVVAASRHTFVARLDRDLLEKELTWGDLSVPPGETGDAHAMASTAAEIEERDWKLSLLRTPLFANLPMSNVQALFDKFEEVLVKAGQVIVREGEQGNYFYLVRKGRCKVVRQSGELEVQLNHLKEGDGFGDEALVSDRPRRATVVMETDGILRRLNKANFQYLMKAPLLKRVEYEEARKWLEGGHCMLIDVRMEDEFAESHLRGAINIPVYLLYLKSQGLSKGLRYVFYCDTGKRGEAAAFMMTQKGFRCFVLNRARDLLAMEEPTVNQPSLTSTEPASQLKSGKALADLLSRGRRRGD